MFLLNSCLSLFSAARPCLAPFLPKLQGHFAEFLDNASPAGLRILSSSTCVGFRYGCTQHNSGFSRRPESHASLLLFAPRHAFGLPDGFSFPAPPALAPVFSFPGHAVLPRPHSSDCVQCRNLHLLSIGYASQPRLRSRLPQGRSALPWNPWIFGRKDSHLPLATHSGILSWIQSTAPYRYSFFSYLMLLYQRISTFPSFGVVFQPRTFSAQDLSTSELLRTL